jgi:hypothetical protein
VQRSWKKSEAIPQLLMENLDWESVSVSHVDFVGNREGFGFEINSPPKEKSSDF